MKAAFLQNASAFINAKIRYKTKSGREKWVEMGYTRYSVVFTGETLPNGAEADAVHIVLNPPYRELLNHVETRPLDYDYLKGLPPGPQRFYELLSFQIYGAIAGGRARAKMLYSDYCKYAPQVRYGDFEHVKKQMYKLHVHHRVSGYIVKVGYQEATDPEGHPDWEMFYTPGPKAFAEYRAFTNRQMPRLPTAEPPSPVTAGKGRAATQAMLDLTPRDPILLTELTRRGIAEAKARDLIANLKPGQEVIDQLEYVDSLIAKDRRKKLENPPGLYVFYIRDNIALPANFWPSRKLREQAQQERYSESSTRAQLEIEYRDYRDEEVNRFATEILPAEEYKNLFDEQRRLNRPMFKSITDEQMDSLTHRIVCDELEKSGRVTIISFEEFCSCSNLKGRPVPVSP